MLDSAYLNVLGRVLLGLIFLISGINKIADPQGTQHYMVLMGMTTMTTLLYIGAVAIEIAGSLSPSGVPYEARGMAPVCLHDSYHAGLSYRLRRSEPDDPLHEEPRHDGRPVVRRAVRWRPLEYGCRTETSGANRGAASTIEESRASIRRQGN